MIKDEVDGKRFLSKAFEFLIGWCLLGPIPYILLSHYKKAKISKSHVINIICHFITFFMFVWVYILGIKPWAD